MESSNSNLHSAFQKQLIAISALRNPHEEITISQLMDMFQMSWSGTADNVRQLTQFSLQFPLHANAIYSLGTIEIMDAIFYFLLNSNFKDDSRLSTKQVIEDVFCILSLLYGESY